MIYIDLVLMWRLNSKNKNLVMKWGGKYHAQNQDKELMQSFSRKISGKEIPWDTEA